MNHLEAAVLADLEKAAALRGEQSRGTDADAALGPRRDGMKQNSYICGNSTKVRPHKGGKELTNLRQL